MTILRVGVHSRKKGCGATPAAILSTLEVPVMQGHVQSLALISTGKTTWRVRPFPGKFVDPKLHLGGS